MRLLAALARRAARGRDRTRRGGRASARRPRLYLLPGLLGSQLGRLRVAGHSRPICCGSTRPISLTVGSRSWACAGARDRRRRPLRPLGIIVYTYLALKLRLEAAGFDVVLYDYDWREDLWSLRASARARRLEADPAAELALVGHSMGGLLARAALAQYAIRRPRDASAADRTLGTPHGGSIGAVQALRATYPALLRLAAMDRAQRCGDSRTACSRAS